METAHLNLCSVQGGLIDCGFPGAQRRLLGLEQRPLQEDPVEAGTPLELDWVFNDQTQDAHRGVRGPTPGIIPAVLADGPREGNLTALEDGQMPHHGGGHPSQGITNEGSSFECHDDKYTVSRNGRTRTDNPVTPSHVRYQIALHSDEFVPTLCSIGIYRNS